LPNPQAKLYLMIDIQHNNILQNQSDISIFTYIIFGRLKLYNKTLNKQLNTKLVTQLLTEKRLIKRRQTHVMRE